MVFVTKRKIIVEDRFPEIEPGLEGLKRAYAICLKDKELPIDAYDKIWWSFKYLNGERSDFFIQLFEIDDKPTKSSNRGFYIKHNLIESTLDFETYLELIIEVLVFSQNNDDTLRKQVERYYKKKKKKIIKIQEYKQSKIAELASYVIYSNKAREGTDGSNYEDYARISIRHGFEVLKAIFDEALGVRLDLFNRLENLEEALHKYLAYFPPNHSLVSHFEVDKNLNTVSIKFKRVPRKLSQKSI